MEQKKPSTKDILAAARAAAAKKEGAVSPEPVREEPAAAESPTGGDAGPEAEEEATSVGHASATPKPTPKSTKDILAAARAQPGGGGAKPAAGCAKSTKDILAAARGEKGAAGKATTQAAPAAAKPKKAAPALKAGAKEDGERPSVQEMLKAVRERQKPETAQPADTIASRPKLPVRPVKPAAATAAGKTRRNFLLALVATPFALAWVFFSLTMLQWLLGAARFMMPNVLIEPPSKFKVGPPSEYPLGTVSNKWKDRFAVWIGHVEYQGKNIIYALSTVCTHLGCTPNWLEGEQKFKCPCHGSGFYISGINFEGPAPRPLERFAIRVAEDGSLEVDKSVKFQQEMGQWRDPASYVEVT